VPAKAIAEEVWHNWERKVDEDWYFNDHVYTNVGYDLISTS